MSEDETVRSDAAELERQMKEDPADGSEKPGSVVLNRGDAAIVFHPDGGTSLAFSKVGMEPSSPVPSHWPVVVMLAARYAKDDFVLSLVDEFNAVMKEVEAAKEGAADAPDTDLV